MIEKYRRRWIADDCHDGTEGTSDWFRITHAEGLPKGWKIVGHKHMNNGEGYGVEPYDVDIYEDSNGAKHEVFAGTFNVGDSKTK